MIELRNVWKGFSGQSILEELSFTVEEGEKLCIIGKSGGGKSVTLKLMTGLLEPDRGQVVINGEDTGLFRPKDWARVLTDFGVVFQGSALFSSLSVFENVGIRLLEERRHPRAEIRDMAAAALESVGLKPSEVMDKFPAELSGGMQKRVGVARAIVHQPRYLFYDEPTTGLDPVSSGMIDELMDSLAQAPNRTSIIITHDMYTVKTIASKVIFIHDRKLHFNGTPAALFASSDPVIRAFLSRSI
jgi:phospholipid/cholesterol/gamma-HCH transport system ATP-binding protein